MIMIYSLAAGGGTLAPPGSFDAGKGADTAEAKEWRPLPSKRPRLESLFSPVSSASYSFRPCLVPLILYTLFFSPQGLLGKDACGGLGLYIRVLCSSF